VSGALIARAGVAPVFREPSLRTEQVTQLVLGETARVLDREGDWRRIRTDDDGYEGWVNAGYTLEVEPLAATEWRRLARGWSEGAVVRVGSGLARLPVRARVGLKGATVRLPDGREGKIIAGSVVAKEDATRSAQAESSWLWAIRVFAGTPYQWGGVTPWGVDCSGLVQTTFRARGVELPRDAALQMDLGDVVRPVNRLPGDLLFFTERGDRVTHVAIAGEDDTLVHSTLSCGGFVAERWAPGTRAAFLRDRLVGVRRVE
jgi:cell wall-associated NlpC family hydrolase